MSLHFCVTQGNINFSDLVQLALFIFLAVQERIYLFAFRKLMDHMELFQSAFAADRMLSRSVVASLDFEPLLPVLLKVPIPVEVMAATLVHHIGIKGYYLNSSKEVCKDVHTHTHTHTCLLYTSPSPRDISGSRMPSSA